MTPQLHTPSDHRRNWLNIVTLILSSFFSALMFSTPVVFLGPFAFLFFFTALICVWRGQSAPKDKELVMMWLLGILLGILFGMARFYIYARFASGGWVD